jgi:hypothetical protein
MKPLRQLNKCECWWDSLWYCILSANITGNGKTQGHFLSRISVLKPLVGFWLNWYRNYSWKCDNLFRWRAKLSAAVPAPLKPLSRRKCGAPCSQLDRRSTVQHRVRDGLIRRWCKQKSVLALSTMSCIWCTRRFGSWHYFILLVIECHHTDRYVTTYLCSKRVATAGFEHRGYC